MSDNTNTTATDDVASDAVPSPVDVVANRLYQVGMTDPSMVTRLIENLGVTSVADLSEVTVADLESLGMKPVPARQLHKALQPAAAQVDATRELADDEEPSKEQVAGFAGQLGMDPTMLLMFMSGQAGDMDISGMMPITTVVNGYNPRRRDMFLMIMGQMERRLGVPIVVIDANGAIDRPLTIEYIEGLEEGYDPAENNIYFGSDGVPHEVIRVGVDAQSVHDADPLDSTRALQKNGMGIGRVNWTNVPLEVRQVAYYAAHTTREIDPGNDAHLTWLRDHMKSGVNRLAFHGQAPRAIAEFNEAARTGSLPTLRVMLSRSPRRPEIMPRRRRGGPSDLTGIGSPRDQL